MLTHKTKGLCAACRTKQSITDNKVLRAKKIIADSQKKLRRISLRSEGTDLSLFSWHDDSGIDMDEGDMSGLGMVKEEEDDWERQMRRREENEKREEEERRMIEVERKKEAERRMVREFLVARSMDPRAHLFMKADLNVI